MLTTSVRSSSRDSRLDRRYGARRHSLTGWRAGSVLTVLLVFSTGSSPSGQHSSDNPPAPKTDRAVASLLSQESSARLARVIIRASTRQHREDLKRRLLEHGDAIEREHEAIEAFTATVHADDLTALAADPAIDNVSIDAIVRVHGAADAVAPGAGAADDAGSAASPLLGTLLLPDAAAAGRGVRVAVLDSGVQLSKDLPASRIAGFFDLTRGPLVIPSRPYDDYGHGTHVAGLIAGNGAASLGSYAGIAPEASIVAFKVLDKNGAGYTSDVIRAIEFILANQWLLQIDVINLSLGHPILEPAGNDPLVLTVERAVAAGIIVVVAGGNLGQDVTTAAQGYGGITSPGNAPSAITVGAVDIRDSVDRSDDVIPAYSSRGPTRYDAIAKPDLVAAGHRLVSVAATSSTLYRDYPTLQVSAGEEVDNGRPRYFRLSGTSMAAAVASGAVALMLDAAGQNRPYFGHTLIKALLEWSAIPIAGTDVLTQGAGSLNVAGALTLVRAIDPTVDVGEMWLANPVMPFTTIAGVEWPWAQVVLWGNRLMSGSVIDTKLAVWGSARTIIWGNASTIIWGNATTIIWGNTKTIIWGNGVVWGEDVVWSDPTLWSTAVVWGRLPGRAAVSAFSDIQQ